MLKLLWFVKDVLVLPGAYLMILPRDLFNRLPFDTPCTQRVTKFFARTNARHRRGPRENVADAHFANRPRPRTPMKIRDFINGLPLGQSSVLARKTRQSDLDEFLRQIWPVTTNRALIRLGSQADGGYLLPDDLQGIEACFSPGVAHTSDFENQIAEKNIPCFLADYSVDGSVLKNPLFHFEKKFLGAINDEKFMTLENWVTRRAPNAKELILQMDIEGHEHAVILESDLSLLERFRIIIIEFHHMEDLWLERGLELIRLTFLKLLKRFEIVHIHPNNNGRLLSRDGIGIPPLMEFTFLRKDRITSKTHTTTFPHPLDHANVHWKRDFALPQCWYKATPR
jgi:hypothetical protein